MKTMKMTMIVALVLCLLVGCTGMPEPVESPDPVSKPSTTPAPTQGPDLGSSGPELEYSKPEIDENYFELYCEDMDLVYHMNNGGSNSVSFFFVSAQKLKNGDVQISTDLGATYDLPVEDAMNTESLLLPLFLSYQGFDWKSYAQLELEDPEEAEKQMDAACQGYYAAKQERPLYGGKLGLPITNLLPAEYVGANGSVMLPSGVDTLEIREITVTVKGQSKTYHPKRFCITEKRLEPSSTVHGMFGTAACDVRLKPSSEGKLTTIPMTYYATEDVSLTGFVFPDYPDNQALFCKLKITPPKGPFIEMDWDCKTPVEVDAGSQLEAELTFSMPQLAGSLGGGGSLYITMTYEKGGETGYAAYHLVYALFSDAYEYYAQKYDGVDVMSYYRDYVAVIEAAKGKAE